MPESSMSISHLRRSLMVIDTNRLLDSVLSYVGTHPPVHPSISDIIIRNSFPRFWTRARNTLFRIMVGRRIVHKAVVIDNVVHRLFGGMPMGLDTELARLQVLG